MRAFACPTCRSLVFFENSRCITCGSGLGYVRRVRDLVVAEADSPRRCANQLIAGCNWLVDPDEPHPQGLCGSCQLTRTRPRDDDPDAMAAFARTEAAKRRLIYQLDHLGLPTTPRSENGQGLAFDLLSSRDAPVTTGHDHGLITIDLAEGSDPHREALRVQLAEPYRTLLGHLRHEVGHWYWDVLVDRTPLLARYRVLFGDDRADYAAALSAHYGAPAGGDWAMTHVSHYAAAHPWEDWAETVAHYLHIRDTMETAQAWGMRVDGPDLDLNVAATASLEVDPDEEARSFDELVRQWIAFTLSLNAVNRSMGKDDLYPFRLRPAVIEKLRFVHIAMTAGRR